MSTLLRLPGVVQRVGFKRSKIYALLVKKEFPEPRRIGGGVFWLDEDIDAFVRFKPTEPPASQPTVSS